MKKVLSVFLATLMFFSVFAVGANAQEGVYDTKWFNNETGKPAAYNQAVLEFDLNSGTMRNPVAVYDFGTGTLSYESGVTGIYYMVPASNLQQTMGMFVTLPSVTPPADRVFESWHCYKDGQDYPAGGQYMIKNVGEVLQFRAQYGPATLEEDTLGKVLGIVVKVIGTIAGILLYGDGEAGTAMIDKLLGGILEGL